MLRVSVNSDQSKQISLDDKHLKVLEIDNAPSSRLQHCYMPDNLETKIILQLELLSLAGNFIEMMVNNRDTETFLIFRLICSRMHSKKLAILLGYLSKETKGILMDI